MRCLKLDSRSDKAQSLLKKIKRHSLACLENIYVSVVSLADIEPDNFRKLRWGDYWFKKELEKEIVAVGYKVSCSKTDVLVHLFGAPINNLPKHTYNILWIHSHPDWIRPEMLKDYDEIFCLSPLFLEKIKSWGFAAELLVGATAKTRAAHKREFDVVFVGNAKGAIGRKIIRDLGDLATFPYNLKIWGEGWQGIIPEKFYGGLYYENEKLPELYAKIIHKL